MKLTIKQDFTYWHGGCRRADYVTGQEVDADDQEMIAVALAEGWATDGAPKEKASKPASTKAHKAAPENKLASSNCPRPSSICALPMAPIKTP